MPNTISLSYSTTMLFCPTNQLVTKLLSIFYSEILKSIFFFCRPPPPPPPPPTGFYFCLPADKATAESVKNNSHTDLEKQTAIASKDKGFSLTKLSLCQILATLVKPPHISASLTLLTTMVCV